MQSFARLLRCVVALVAAAALSGISAAASAREGGLSSPLRARPPTSDQRQQPNADAGKCRSEALRRQSEQRYREAQATRRQPTTPLAIPPECEIRSEPGIAKESPRDDTRLDPDIPKESPLDSTTGGVAGGPGEPPDSGADVGQCRSDALRAQSQQRYNEAATTGQQPTTPLAIPPACATAAQRPVTIEVPLTVVIPIGGSGGSRTGNNPIIIVPPSAPGANPGNPTTTPPGAGANDRRCRDDTVRTQNGRETQARGRQRQRPLAPGCRPRLGPDAK